MNVRGGGAGTAVNSAAKKKREMGTLGRSEYPLLSNKGMKTMVDGSFCGDRRGRERPDLNKTGKSRQILTEHILRKN